MKKAKSARPKDELKQELRDQLGLLRRACQSYDEGFEASAKHIALTLRVLLHHHRTSNALLMQLGLRDTRFLDSAGDLSPHNLLTECNLLVMTMDSTGGSYMPAVLAGGGFFPLKPRPFSEWWISPVLKDIKGRTMSRMDIIQNVANTDGGAHVDAELDEVYMAVSRSNSLGWIFQHGNAPPVALGKKPELACVRQIAHEVLSTLHAGGSEFSSAASPVLPNQ